MDQQQKIEETLKKAEERAVEKQQVERRIKQIAVDRAVAETERINQHNSRFRELVIRQCTDLLLEKRKCWRRSRVTMVREGRYTLTFNVWGTWRPHLDDKPVKIYSWQRIEYYTKPQVEDTIIRSLNEVLPKAKDINVFLDEARNCLRGPDFSRRSDGELDRDCDTIGLLFCAGLPLITRGLGWLVDRAVPRTRVTVTFTMRF